MSECSCAAGAASERIPMVNVTARVNDQSGRPVQRARVTMRLTTIERYCGLVVPREITQYTDASGVAILRVWPNELGTEGSEYMVTIMYGDAKMSESAQCGCSPATQSQRFRAVVPNVDCDLFDIVDLPPYEHRGSGLVITSEVASHANRAGAAADRAENAAERVEIARTEAEAFASESKAARDGANISSNEAQKQASRAQSLVDGLDSTILHFETTVVERTEKLAEKRGQDAVACIRQAEVSGLESIEARLGDVLNEISQSAASGKIDARNAINCAAEAALGDIRDAAGRVQEDFREEARLFGEDFEALTERAETAAKRAGCSTAAAANAASKACACADRADTAAQALERHCVDVEIAARQVETAKICAETAAGRAERAADIVQQNVDLASGSAKAAQESAKAADCAALLAKSGADACAMTQEAIRADKEVIERLSDKAGELVPKAEAMLSDIEEMAGKNAETLELLGEKTAEIKDAAERAGKAADMAVRQVETGEELLKAATQGATNALLAADGVKADAARIAEDRAAVEEARSNTQTLAE